MQWVPGMGCSASVLLLQALRSVLRGGNCGRMCARRQQQVSVEMLPPLEEGAEGTNQPYANSAAATVIVTVMTAYMEWDLWNF